MSSVKVSLERPLIRPPFSKLVFKRLELEYRKATSSWRSLPDFIIAGAQKCGTSSLHRYFEQHPKLAAACVKEVHYFDGGLDPIWDKYSDGERLYRSYFPFESVVKKNNIQCFEASPCYLFNPVAIERMAKLIPNVRLVILLRDPVERAISHYFHELRRGRESAGIVEAFDLEDERLSHALNSNNYKDTRYINLSYKARGRYAEQLARVYNYFSHDQVMVLEAESFFENPLGVMKDILEFVGSEPFPSEINIKPTGVGGNKIDVPDGVRDSLRDYFLEPNMALNNLLAKNFRWM